MAGQNLERREVLRVLSLAASASLSPHFSRWVFAGSEHQAGHAGLKQQRSGPTAPYRPQFFSEREYAAIKALTERIIPTDDTPGAREAGVSEFVDFMVWSDPTVQARFRRGLADVDSQSRTRHGQPFASLPTEEQDGILTTMAEAAPGPPVDDDANFFHLIREYTVMGFYTSKVGMEQIGDPGLQTFYAAAPGCPHLDDPEHLKIGSGRG